MTRLPTIDPATATGSAGELLARTHQTLGLTPNMTKVMANSPALLKGYLDLYAALAGGRLDAGVRERIAVTVAEHNGCGYCLSAHTYIGEHIAKVPAEEMERGTSGAQQRAAHPGRARPRRRDPPHPRRRRRRDARSRPRRRRHRRRDRRDGRQRRDQRPHQLLQQPHPGRHRLARRHAACAAPPDPKRIARRTACPDHLSRPSTPPRLPRRCKPQKTPGTPAIRTPSSRPTRPIRAGGTGRNSSPAATRSRRSSPASGSASSTTCSAKTSGPTPMTASRFASSTNGTTRSGSGGAATATRCGNSTPTAT